MKGPNLISTGAVLGVAAGLTAIGTIVAPVSLYAVALIRKDSKMQRTALLAGEAVADSEVVSTFLKHATRRIRPEAVPPGRIYVGRRSICAASQQR